ncbi:hypothetical protein PAA8504_02395 [Palleronia abyssalis]|uniref:Uncharacterized protein n=1 Tax=Palleronia abyssalis TaxID=1501240 RepID=A0A2R8BWQ3_9RHOB|nr:hypothetical protein PAA8504_02395 [Palleronia abyssalis]
MPTLSEYFDHLAEIATDAVKDEDNGPPVVDGPQDPAATAWSALAVHPMSMMETSYVAAVQKAVSHAGDPQEKLDAAFEALSGYYALHKDSPILLAPNTELLIDERILGLQSEIRRLEVIAQSDPSRTYNSLCGIVGEAAEILDSITSRDTVEFASEPIRDVAQYLGYKDLASTEDIVRAWADKNPEGDGPKTERQLDDVNTEVVEQLGKPNAAAASPRSLYNIGPFYLYRLMHRFVGGAPGKPMDLKAKGDASGSVTGVMHRPDWTWMARWHQERITDLGQRLEALDLRLKQDFGVGNEVLRYFLKGGRAMYTALHRPQEGGNDWDTGILINPDLRPEDWYTAFARVNDLVAIFLDEARFGYTELLERHRDQLLDPQPLQLAAHDGPRLFSRLALQAEHAEPMRATEPFRPAGVNGELIDIGVSARNTVELREHWRVLHIVKAEGIDGIATPVPTLPYFVDDFSTMIREAIQTNTVGRKLAKRLERLLTVLSEPDANLMEHLKRNLVTVTKAMPMTAEELELTPTKSDPWSMMLTWGLAALLNDTAIYAARQTWVAAFDTFAAENLPRLLKGNTEFDEMWQQIEPGIKNRESVAACREVFLAQCAVGTLADDIVADYQTVGQAVIGKENYQKAVNCVLEIIDNGYSKPIAGTYYRTGWLGLLAQARHVGVTIPMQSAPLLGGSVELYYRAEGTKAEEAFDQLAQAAGTAVAQYDVTVDAVNIAGQPALVVQTRNPLLGLKITEASTVLLVIRPEPLDGPTHASVLDFLNRGVTASIRDLSRLYTDRAASSEDFLIRSRGRHAAEFVLLDLLGRQLKT